MKNLFTILVLWANIACCTGQGLSNLWLLGAATNPQNLTQRAQMEFSSGSMALSTVQLPMMLKDVAATITDRQGNLLFYTNGVWIADRTHAKMPNGDSLSPGWNTNSNIQYNNGSLLSQSVVIIPKPGDTAVYYLFHVTMEGPPVYSGQHLWLTTVDMRLRGGLGDVVSKNQVLLQQDLTPARLTAVKHANGRDYWLMVQEHYTNKYFRYLITPEDILGPYSQTIGTMRGREEGGARFSPNGSRYATFETELKVVELYNFDRCTGLLSNPVRVVIDDSAFTNIVFDGGLTFSSNSQVLYVFVPWYVFQLNAAAGTPAAIAASLQKVAIWDGFYDPLGWPFATNFLKAELAPDGKIYITTGNSTQFLHEIHQPDSLGPACNVTQHSIQLPCYNSNALPNHPNYHLGPLVGSPCDTLTSAATEPIMQVPVQLYPNPNNGEFSISFAPQPLLGELQVYDVLGKLVFQEAVAQWSQLKRLSLPQLKQGVYHCRMSWGEKSGVVRFVKSE